VHPHRRTIAVGLLSATLVATTSCGADETDAGGPTETKIAFTSRGIWVVASDGRGLAKLSAPYRRTRRTELRPEWSPHGRRLAFRAYLERDALSGGAAYHLYVMNADGSGVRNLTRRHFRETGDFDWSPDGRQLVVDVWNERIDRHRLHVIRTDGGRPRLLTRGDDFGAHWSPDGSTIAFNRFGRGGRAALYAIASDGTRLRRLARRANGPAWSPDGARVAYFAGFGPTAIHLIDPNGGGRRRLARVPGEIGELAWSPDGASIAYMAHRPRRGWDIHVVDTVEGRRTRLTDDRGDEVSPTWSPDGTRIAYERSPVGGNVDNTGTYDVYVMNADGTGKRRLTRCGCTAGGGLSWQPPP
jgi:Tol biopolymer transport system component